MSLNNSHSGDDFSTKPGSSTAVPRQQNHSTQLPATPESGSRDDGGGENFHELFSRKTTRQMIMQFWDHDDDEPNFPWVAETEEEYFGSPVKPKSTVEATASKGKVSTKPGSSTAAQQQQNHSTQLPAAPKNGSRDDDSGENTHELSSGKTTPQIIKEFCDQDDEPNFPFFAKTMEEYFGLPVKRKSTVGAAASKGKERKVEE